MRSKRSWAWAGLGASSLLAFLAACGSVNETFTINVNTLDAGSDSGPAPSDATVADGSAPDASSDATVPDGSVQDAEVDAGVDAGPGPVVPDGGSVVIVGDAAVVIPPLDPGLLGGADGGIVISDGGLANADGGALTPRQFRDLVNGITCQRISECCCPGCTASETSQVFSGNACVNTLGTSGLSFILTGNEGLNASTMRVDMQRAASCVALLNDTVANCQTLDATKVQLLRSVCLTVFESTNQLGASCTSNVDCAGAAKCSTGGDAGRQCIPLVAEGEKCGVALDCSARAVSGNPPLYCAPADGGSTCRPYLTAGSTCTFDLECGAGACNVQQDGSRRCSASLPFASQTDPASYCARFAPPRDQ